MSDLTASEGEIKIETQPVSRDVAELRNLVTSSEFRDGFVACRTKKERDELMAIEAEVTRAANAEVGRQIPIAAAGKTGIDPETAHELRRRKKIGEKLSQQEAEAVDKWNTAIVLESKEVQAKKPQLVEEAKRRLREDPVIKNLNEEATSGLELAQQEASAVVEGLVDDVESRLNDPQLVEALEVWGRCPNAKGEIGSDADGFNAGVIHYFEYRAILEKSGRFRDQKFGIDHFIEHSRWLRSIVANPKPDHNSDVQMARRLRDETGQTRLFVLTKKHDWIVAFGQEDEVLPKVITVIPGQDEKTMNQAVAESLAGENTRRLNRLKGKTTEIQE